MKPARGGSGPGERNFLDSFWQLDAKTRDQKRIIKPPADINRRVRSPLRAPPKTPTRVRSRSPRVRNNIVQPIRNRSSPARRFSPGLDPFVARFLRVGSPEPMRKRSPELIRIRSPGPIRRRSPEIVRRRSPGPMWRRSPEIMRRRSPDQIRRSPEPMNRRGLVAMNRKSPEVVRRRSLSPRRTPPIAFDRPSRFSPGNRQRNVPQRGLSPTLHSPTRLPPIYRGQSSPIAVSPMGRRIKLGSIRGGMGDGPRHTAYLEQLIREQLNPKLINPAPFHNEGFLKQPIRRDIDDVTQHVIRNRHSTNQRSPHMQHPFDGHFIEGNLREQHLRPGVERQPERKEECHRAGVQPVKRKIQSDGSRNNLSRRVAKRRGQAQVEQSQQRTEVPIRDAIKRHAHDEERNSMEKRRRSSSRRRSRSREPRPAGSNDDLARLTEAIVNFIPAAARIKEKRAETDSKSENINKIIEVLETASNIIKKQEFEQKLFREEKPPPLPPFVKKDANQSKMPDGWGYQQFQQPRSHFGNSSVLPPANFGSSTVLPPDSFEINRFGEQQNRPGAIYEPHRQMENEAYRPSSAYQVGRIGEQQPVMAVPKNVDVPFSSNFVKSDSDYRPISFVGSVQDNGQRFVSIPEPVPPPQPHNSDYGRPAIGEPASSIPIRTEQKKDDFSKTGKAGDDQSTTTEPLPKPEDAEKYVQDLTRHFNKMVERSIRDQTEKGVPMTSDESEISKAFANHMRQNLPGTRERLKQIAQALKFAVGQVTADVIMKQLKFNVPGENGQPGSKPGKVETLTREEIRAVSEPEKFVRDCAEFKEFKQNGYTVDENNLEDSLKDQTTEMKQTIRKIRAALNRAFAQHEHIPMTSKKSSMSLFVNDLVQDNTRTFNEGRKKWIRNALKLGLGPALSLAFISGMKFDDIQVVKGQKEAGDQMKAEKDEIFVIGHVTKTKAHQKPKPTVPKQPPLPPTEKKYPTPPPLPNDSGYILPNDGGHFSVSTGVKQFPNRPAPNAVSGFPNSYLPPRPKSTRLPPPLEVAPRPFFGSHPPPQVIPNGGWLPHSFDNRGLHQYNHGLSQQGQFDRGSQLPAQYADVKVNNGSSAAPGKTLPYYSTTKSLGKSGQVTEYKCNHCNFQNSSKQVYDAHFGTPEHDAAFKRKEQMLMGT